MVILGNVFSSLLDDANNSLFVFHYEIKSNLKLKNNGKPKLPLPIYILVLSFFTLQDIRL